jgi:gluconate 5-dehydrogenase
MNNIFDLKDKVAIVTGGYGHLGTGIVNALLAYGATVYVAGRTKEKFYSKFINETANLKFVEVDILSSISIKKSLENVFNQEKRIDILINNAHSAKGNSQENMSDDDFLYTLDGVLGSVHKCIREVLPFMKENKEGKIINISSMYGHISPNFDKLYKGENCEKYTNPPHYGAAKAGVIQMTKYYAALLGKDNIYVNAISPGPFSKDQIQKENPAFIEKLKSSNPLNRIGNPKDLSGVIILLSSSASDFITGQNIKVDGGWSIW